MVLRTRPGRDDDELAVIRWPARARKAPRDLVMRARMVDRSWAGLAGAGDRGWGRLRAEDRAPLAAPFQPLLWPGGLEDLDGQGRKRRITEAERSRSPPWSERRLRAIRRFRQAGIWRRTSRGRRSGRLMHWPLLPVEAGWRWEGFRFAGSCWPKACVGAAPGPGPVHRTRISREKNTDRRPVHQPARRRDGRLRRRAWAGDPAAFPPAPGWSPDGHASSPKSTAVADRRRPGSTVPCRYRTATKPRWQPPRQRLLPAVPAAGRERQPGR
ncbi:hypothetical protein SNOUR_10190 [Streptomyces noursei ATCC 11455]|nr:hypothetical protein SNOUR_10190 [Streptomyces noursei ATCC 11455]